MSLFHNAMELEELQSPHLVGKAAILGICLDSDDKRLKHPYTCRCAGSACATRASRRTDRLSSCSPSAVTIWPSSVACMVQRCWTLFLIDLLAQGESRLLRRPRLSRYQ